MLVATRGLLTACTTGLIGAASPIHPPRATISRRVAPYMSWQAAADRDGVNYVGSYLTPKEMPGIQLPEICLAGRSNVGKSSALNRLSGRKKKVAVVSKSPGRTRTLNLYQVGKVCCLTDLPGYGFAKVNRDMQDQWRKSIELYLTKRQQLKLAILFVVRTNRPPPGSVARRLAAYAPDSRCSRVPHARYQARICRRVGSAARAAGAGRAAARLPVLLRHGDARRGDQGGQAQGQRQGAPDPAAQVRPRSRRALPRLCGPCAPRRAARVSRRCPLTRARAAPGRRCRESLALPVDQPIAFSSPEGTGRSEVWRHIQAVCDKKRK